jgi:hypothetical protein
VILRSLGLRIKAYNQLTHAACRNHDVLLAGCGIHSPRCHCDHSRDIYAYHPQHHSHRRPKQPVDPGMLVTRTGFLFINSARYYRQRYAFPGTCRRQRDLQYCSCSIRWWDTQCPHETVCIIPNLSYSCPPQKPYKNGALLIRGKMGGFPLWPGTCHFAPFR